MIRLPINLDDMAEAFDNSFDEFLYSLDTESGEVIMVRREFLHLMDELLSKGELPTQDEPPDMEPLLESQELPDWQLPELADAYRVQAGYPGRFIAIPVQDSAAGYRDMEAFIETVADDHLADLLRIAIQGRGAFRRFKDVLLGYPDERTRWFAFRDERVVERVLAWLTALGIEVEEGEQHG